MPLVCMIIAWSCGAESEVTGVDVPDPSDLGAWPGGVLSEPCMLPVGVAARLVTPTTTAVSVVVPAAVVSAVPLPGAAVARWEAAAAFLSRFVERGVVGSGIVVRLRRCRGLAVIVGVP